MALSTGGRRPRGPGCLQPPQPVRVRPRGTKAPGAACRSCSSQDRYLGRSHNAAGGRWYSVSKPAGAFYMEGFANEGVYPGRPLRCRRCARSRRPGRRPGREPSRHTPCRSVAWLSPLVFEHMFVYCSSRGDLGSGRPGLLPADRRAAGTVRRAARRRPGHHPKSSGRSRPLHPNRRDQGLEPHATGAAPPP
jgi:hypothetical protein